MFIGRIKTNVRTGASIVFVLALALSAPSASTEGNKAEDQVLEVLMAQQLAWNRGDIPGFMQAYLNSEDLRFLSGDTVEHGWQATLERYYRVYPDRAAMGKLSFVDLNIRVLSPEYAFVFGGYTLDRESDSPTGLFTLLLQNTEDGWRVVHDHSSSAPVDE